jgi:hypothetical protein
MLRTVDYLNNLTVHVHSYSVDYGKSFHEFEFSDIPIKVTAISGNPSLKGSSVLVVGLLFAPQKDAKQVIVNLEFDPLMSGDCKF